MISLKSDITFQKNHFQTSGKVDFVEYLFTLHQLSDFSISLLKTTSWLSNKVINKLSKSSEKNEIEILLSDISVFEFAEKRQKSQL